MSSCNRGLMQAYKLARVEQENATSFSLWLDGELPNASPGQYVMVWLPGVGERPFSLHSASPLALTISCVGPSSKAICALPPGGTLWLRGPFGKGYVLEGKNHLLVGGGYGAAPLTYLAEEALIRGDEVRVCLGAASAKDLMFVEKLREIGAGVFVATDDGSQGTQGLVTAVVLEQILHHKPDSLYACGPTGMLMALWDLCEQHNIVAQLSFEGIIRCGIGLCGSCELNESLCAKLGLPAGWLVCHDGPVARLMPSQAKANTITR